MRLSGIGRGVAGLAVVIGIALSARPAPAVKEFRDEFEARFVKYNSRKRPDAAFAKAVQEAQCTVCHPGDNKHKLNLFGSQVGQVVNKLDKANKARIQQALDRAATLSSDPYMRGAPTFGTLFKKGKLPPSPAPPEEK